MTCGCGGTCGGDSVPLREGSVRVGEWQPRDGVARARVQRDTACMAAAAGSAQGKRSMLLHDKTFSGAHGKKIIRCFYMAFLLRGHMHVGVVKRGYAHLGRHGPAPGARPPRARLGARRGQGAVALNRAADCGSLPVLA